MPRLMSFSMTVDAMRERRKTVTRRLGWSDLKPGTVLRAVEKAQGLRCGERVRDIGLIRVVRVSREPVSDIHIWGPDEVRREGLNLMPFQFEVLFCTLNRCDPSQMVQRIEFEHISEEE